MRAPLFDVLVKAGRPMSDEDLAKPAVIFAPHPDDETLGCGGTVIRKRRAGVPVTIVFMTDGGNSQPGLIPRSEIVALRMEEAWSATARLGVARQDVVFLGVRDGELSGDDPTAIAKVAALIERLAPAQVFCPLRFDVNKDHVATCSIVRRALEKLDASIALHEFPIWALAQWPMVRAFDERRRGSITELSDGARFTYRLLRHAHVAVDISDALEQKRAALDAYATQLSRVGRPEQWWTLHDVAGGEFFTHFLQPHELFYRYRW